MNKDRQHILVVDDEGIVLRTLVRLLSREYEVQGVESLEAAKAAMTASRPGLLLCDLHLKDAGPVAILKALAEFKVDRRTVFMSGGAMSDQDETSFEELPGPLLRKPFDPNRLRQVLAGLDKV